MSKIAEYGSAFDLGFTSARTTWLESEDEGNAPAMITAHSHRERAQKHAYQT